MLPIWKAIDFETEVGVALVRPRSAPLPHKQSPWNNTWKRVQETHEHERTCRVIEHQQRKKMYRTLNIHHISGFVPNVHKDLQTSKLTLFEVFNRQLFAEMNNECQSCAMVMFLRTTSVAWDAYWEQGNEQSLPHGRIASPETCRWWMNVERNRTSGSTARLCQEIKLWNEWLVAGSVKRTAGLRQETESLLWWLSSTPAIDTYLRSYFLSLSLPRSRSLNFTFQMSKLLQDSFTSKCQCRFCRVFVQRSAVLCKYPHCGFKCPISFLLKQGKLFWIGSCIRCAFQNDKKEPEIHAAKVGFGCFAKSQSVEHAVNILLNWSLQMLNGWPIAFRCWKAQLVSSSTGWLPHSSEKQLLSGNPRRSEAFYKAAWRPTAPFLLPAGATGTGPSRWDVSAPVTHYFLKYWQQSWPSLAS